MGTAPKHLRQSSTPPAQGAAPPAQGAPHAVASRPAGRRVVLPERAVSPGRRAGLLLAAALCSCAAAVGICYVVGLVAGPTSAGGWFNRFWFAFFATCGFLAATSVICRDWFADKPENLYLVVVLATTMLFSWSLSARKMGWDVGTHYDNILNFADWQGDIDLSVSDDSIAGAGQLVEGDGELAHVDALEEGLDQNSDVLARTKEHVGRLVWYVTGIEYVPYALVMRLCRTVRLSFTHTLTLMRMTGGLFYSLVTYLGMRKLREGKMLYATIALLPTSVFLAAELGWSYWLFSLCLYGFATMAGMMQGSVEVRTSNLVRMLLALLLGILPRAPYFPLVFLCLLVPADSFAHPRADRRFKLLLVCAAIGAFAVWFVPKLLAGLGTGDARGGEGVSPADQLAFIVSHPAKYARTVLRFVLPPLSMEGGAADVEGKNLITGFLSPEASPGLLVNYGYYPRAHAAFTGCVWVLLALTTLTDKYRDGHVGWVAGLVALLVVVGEILLWITALYMQFTPVGLDEVHGMQRRYLLPMLFPLLVFVGPHALGLRGRVRDGAYNAVVLVGMATVLLASWWMVCVSHIV